MTLLLRSLWIWTASAALVIFWVPLLATVRLFDRNPLHLKTGRWFRRLGRLLAKVQPWRVQVSGCENILPAQAYVIVSNHQSLADIPLISHLRLDTKWLAKAELFQLPVVGWMLRMAGDVPVERGVPRQAVKALRQCANYLRLRCSVVFFPEGGRSADGQVLPFNKGAFQLAIREQVPILPLVVEGTGDALPRNNWIFGANQDVRLKVLEAVPVDRWGITDCDALTDLVRQKIVDELCRLRTPGGITR